MTDRRRTECCGGDGHHEAPGASPTQNNWEIIPKMIRKQSGWSVQAMAVRGMLP
jgi:hypothetical protein